MAGRGRCLESYYLMSAIKIDSDVNPTETLTPDVQQLTVFSDPGDAEVMAAAPLAASVMKSLPQTWIDRLSRPVFLGAYGWSSGQDQNAVLFAMRFPEALFTDDNVQECLKRVSYFRAKVVVQLRLNSTAFHYGLLQLSWLPGTDCTVTTPVANMNTAPFRNIFASSNNEWTLLSANHRDTVEIEIPWVCPTEFLYLLSWITGPTNSGSGQAAIGSLVARVVQPLHMANAQTATTQISVHAFFKDVEIGGFTEFPVDFSTAVINVASSVVTQAGEAKEANRMKGVVSGVLERVAKFSRGLVLMPIPQVSAAAGTVSHVASVLSSAFRSVGLSKPYMAADPQAMTLVPSSMAHANGVSVLPKLSLLHESQVDETDRYVGDSRMLDISSWHEKPVLLLTKVLMPSSNTGDVLLQMPVTPSMSPPSTTLTGLQYPLKIDPTYYGWYTMLHKYWRGSMKYKFLFTCSQFTTMRVLIAWTPDYNSSTTLSALLAGNVISRVVDIAGDTEVEFMIPQCTKTAWLDTTYGPAGTNNNFRWDGANGYVWMLVLNPIVTSGTGTSSDQDVHFTVMSAPGPDFQLAVPVPLPRTVTPVIIPQASYVSDFSKPFPGLHGGSLFVDKGACIGDATSNILQLLKRYHYYRTAAVGASTTGPADTNLLYAITGAGNVTIPDPLGTVATGNTGINMLQLYMAPWMFARGGWRLRTVYAVQPPTSASGSATVSLFFTLPLKSSGPPVGTPADIAVANLLPCQNILSGVPVHAVVGTNQETGVEVPWYSRYYHFNPFPKGQNSAMAMRDVRVVTTASTSWVFFCMAAAADNFALGTLTAPPSLYYSNS